MNGATYDLPRGGPPKPLSSFITATVQAAATPPANAPLVDPASVPMLRTHARGNATLAASGKRPTSRRQRRHVRVNTINQLSLVGQEINAPPIPEDAIAFIATFLVHATLPYKDPGPVDYWERSNGDITIVFEPGLAPRDANGHRRRVGLPFGIYPRIILSWITTQAVRTGSARLSLGESFTDWIRSDLHLDPTGGVNGTITRIREQVTRMLAMKITVSAVDTDKKLFANLSLVPIEGVAAFWDPLQPQHHDIRRPTFLLNQHFFQEALRSSVPFHHEVQLELAKRHACMAIDLYRLLTLKQFAICKAQKKTPELIPWSTLSGLLGQANARRGDFKRQVAGALELILPLYPGANAEPRHRGLLIRPGAPHIPPKAKAPRSSRLLVTPASNASASSASPATPEDALTPAARSGRSAAANAS